MRTTRTARMMRCPTCKGDVSPHSPLRPFCSRRCKLIDLGKWLDGSYSIPGEPASEDDLEPASGDEDPKKH